MTDITKRLAEALRDVSQTLAWDRFGECRGYSEGKIKTAIDALACAKTILADFDRTAAQEANVQDDSWACANCGQHNAAWAHTCGRCGCSYAAAPHPTPAPASVEVTDAEVEAACESWLTRSRWRSSIDEVRKETFRITMRRALEAATRARQGEGGRQVIGAINLTDMAKFLRGTATQCMSHGKTAAEAYEFCASELDKLAAGAITIPASGTVAAPNAADAEAYLTPRLADAEKLSEAIGLHNLVDHTGGNIISDWLVLEGLERIGAVIPTAAPVPAEQDRVGRLQIYVEKELCSLLGRPWATSGFSIETLIADLRKRLAVPADEGEKK